MNAYRSLAVLGSALLAASAAAAEATYQATMTGVTCNGCKATVTAAFKRISSVRSVEVTAGPKTGTQVVIVKAASEELTKDQAVKALGDRARRFIVVDWKQQRSPAAKAD